MKSYLFNLYLQYHPDYTQPTKKYYVYVHRNPLTEKVFYVGSAQGNRMRAYEFTKHRSSKWKEEVRSFGGISNLIVEIVQYFDNPYDAQKQEFSLICYLRKNGEAYCNFEGVFRKQRKNLKLHYEVIKNKVTINFNTKTELYSHCYCEYGLSKNLVNVLINTGKEYDGVKVGAKGLKILQKGVVHM